MAQITKENLKKLLDYGLVAEHEQDKILFSFENKPMAETKKSILDVLDANIKSADIEDKAAEKDMNLALAKQKELAKEIFELKKQKSKIKANKEIEKYNKGKIAHSKRIQGISAEYRRALRRLDEFMVKADKAMNERELAKIKSALK